MGRCARAKLYAWWGGVTVFSTYAATQAFLLIKNVSETDTLSYVLKDYPWTPYVVIGGALVYGGYELHNKQKTTLVDTNADRIYSLEGEHEKTKQELKETKEELKDTKQELKVTKEELKETKQDVENLARENAQKGLDLIALKKQMAAMEEREAKRAENEAKMSSQLERLQTTLTMRKRKPCKKKHGKSGSAELNPHRFHQPAHSSFGAGALIKSGPASPGAPMPKPTLAPSASPPSSIISSPPPPSPASSRASCF